MAAPGGYFEVLEGTLELIARLEAFVRGEVTGQALQTWALEQWQRVPHGQGPLLPNRIASHVMDDLTGAGREMDTGQPIFRRVDAELWLRELRQGRNRDLVRYVASPNVPFEHFVQQLKLPTERHIIPGIGWHEFLYFASPATGTVFLIRVPLEDYTIVPEPKVPLFCVQGDASPLTCLVDLLETLAIDRSDLSWVADEMATSELPTWALWRQDDNGNEALVQSFTGYRKARAELARFEALGHKQTYWLDGPKP
jgi:hypothetical protein